MRSTYTSPRCVGDFCRTCRYILHYQILHAVHTVYGVAPMQYHYHTTILPNTLLPYVTFRSITFCTFCYVHLRSWIPLPLPFYLNLPFTNGTLTTCHTLLILHRVFDLPVAVVSLPLKAVFRSTHSAVGVFYRSLSFTCSHRSFSTYCGTVTTFRFLSCTVRFRCSARLGACTYHALLSDFRSRWCGYLPFCYLNYVYY